MIKTNWRAVLVGCVLLVSLCLWLFQSQQASTGEELYVDMEQVQSVQQETVVKEIVVHVAGAVEHPGVYTLFEGQRIDDAVALAGVTAQSDVDSLNRAALLSDGQKIIVPVKSEYSSVEVELDDERINLNQADLGQLMTLPGIGEVKAQAILAYREENGSFSQIEDVQKVHGIGAATFMQIKNKIKI